VVVISHGLWLTAFAADRGVIGRTIDLDGQAFTLVGVMPEDFHYPLRAQLWTPVVPAAPQVVGDPGVWWAIVIGRLRDSVTLAEARSEMDGIVDRLQRERNGPGFGAVITPAVDEMLGSTKGRLRLLAAAVGLVMLAACGSAAGVVLIRTTRRRREMSVRMALGASPRRLATLLLGESFLMALVAGLLGLVLALLGVRLLVALAPAGLLRASEASLDLRAVAFALGVSLLSGTLVGLAPAWQATRRSVVEVLKTGSSTLAARNRAGALLVGAEVAFAIALLVPAGLIGQSLFRLRSVDPGFDARHLLAMEVLGGREGYSVDKRRVLWKALVERVERMPGVVSSGGILLRPLWGTVGMDWWVVKEGQSDKEALERNPTVVFEAATPSYFRTMRIPVLKGRVFDEHDVDGSPGAIVLSQSMAERIWPGQDPIGRRLKMPVPETRYHMAWLSVIGVVGDVRYRELEAIRPTAYMSFLQAPDRLRHLLVRTDREPAPLASLVRQEIRALDQDLAVEDVTTMEDVVSTSVSGLLFAARVLTALAVFAALTAAMAVYASVAYSVAQRSRDIGVRMVLGATERRVLSEVVRDGLTAPVLGLLVGLSVALGLGRLFESVLFGVTGSDPSTLAAASAAVAFGAFLATYVPARHAARIEPASALRQE
jgi:putative ABC transport system permease protein